MHIEIFIQARMGSTRLPGKVLAPVLGKPLLEYQIERVRRSTKADGYAILTTNMPQDDVIVDFCKQNHINYFRGESEDVLDRYYKAALKSNAEAIVRITSDCPLIDPAIIDTVIETYCKEYPKWDYVSNTLQRTFPRGLDVEIFSMDTLEKAFKNASDPCEREHVTLYMYRHPEIFKLKNIASPINLGQHRWTVDTPEDLKLIKLLLETLYEKNPMFTTEDILNILKQHPEWEKINKHITQKSV